MSGGFLTNQVQTATMSKTWSFFAMISWGGAMLTELWVTRFDTNLDNPSASSIQTVMCMLSVAMFIFALFMWQKFDIGDHVKTEIAFLLLGLAYVIIWAFSNLWVTDDAKLKPHADDMGQIAKVRLAFWVLSMVAVLILLANTIHRWRLSRSAAPAAASAAPSAPPLNDLSSTTWE
jgi:hypothetical protein